MSHLRRLIITRPLGRNDRLADGLRGIGVEPVEVPAVAIMPPASFEAPDRALRRLEAYDWVLLTSVHGVEALASRGRALSLPGWPARLRWAAIGPATAAALRAQGIAHVWMPSRFTSDAVGEEMPVQAGQRVLRIGAERASPIPAARLRVRGAQVDEVVAYRTLEAPASSRALLREAMARGVDGVIFTSASTVRGLLRLADEIETPRDRLRHMLIVAIGPVTVAALDAEGFRADVVASVHSIEGIIAALREGRAVHADLGSA